MYRPEGHPWGCWGPVLSRGTCPLSAPRGSPGSAARGAAVAHPVRGPPEPGPQRLWRPIPTRSEPHPTCTPLWPFEDEATAYGQRLFYFPALLLPSSRMLPTGRGALTPGPHLGGAVPGSTPFPISTAQQSSPMTLSQGCSSSTPFLTGSRSLLAPCSRGLYWFVETG